jgi:hypothetical protein
MVRPSRANFTSGTGAAADPAANPFFALRRRRHPWHLPLKASRLRCPAARFYPASSA